MNRHQTLNVLTDLLISKEDHTRQSRKAADEWRIMDAIQLSKLADQDEISIVQIMEFYLPV
jgi:hypothetical protein